MFGLQNKDPQPSKKESLFDLEVELQQNPLKLKEYLTRIENRVNQIKALMRSGSGGGSYDQYNTLLLAYAGALKILGRIKIKK
jgi:hypothetical protein